MKPRFISLFIAAFLLIIYWSCNICAHSSNEFDTIELYITPRLAKYGFFDNGIYRFPLQKKSIKNAKHQGNYYTEVSKDSIYELFYIDYKINSSSSIYGFNSFQTDSCVFETPRILIIKNRIDTMEVDSFKKIRSKKDGVCFGISDTLWNHIFYLMPEEMKYNWSKEIPNKVIFIKKG